MKSKIIIKKEPEDKASHYSAREVIQRIKAKMYLEKLTKNLTSNKRKTDLTKIVSGFFGFVYYD